MEFFSEIYYGNTITDWCIAFAILLGSFILTKLFYWVFSNVIKKITARTKSTVDDVLVNKLEKPIIYFIIILGYWIAVHWLNSSEWPENILPNLEKIAYLALVFNLTSVVSRVIDALISEVIMPITEKTESEFDDQLIPVIRKGIKAIIWVLGIIIGLDNIGFDIAAMIAGLGIGGLALALAAQDSIKNIFAGVMIFLDKPFKMKDRIQINGFDGIVEEVGIRSTRIRTLEGRIVTIPNCTFTDNSVINVTSQPALKIKLNLGLTYDTDEVRMQKALDIIGEIVSDNRELIEENYYAGFNQFGDFSLNILFIYYIRPDAHWLDSQTVVSKEILKRFNAENLEFAFPTQTIFKKELK